MHAFITHDGRFHIVSHGNGWAYAVTCQATGDSFWVQDSDADMLQKETQDFDNTDSLYNYFAD